MSCKECAISRLHIRNDCGLGGSNPGQDTSYRPTKPFTVHGKIKINWHPQSFAGVSNVKHGRREDKLPHRYEAGIRNRYSATRIGILIEFMTLVVENRKENHCQMQVSLD